YGLSRSAFPSVYRTRLADACRLGRSSPSVGQSDLAFHSNILVRLHDLRYPDRRLVPRRSTVAHSRPIISFATTCGTVDAPGAHRSIPAMRRVRQCLLNACPWSVPLAEPHGNHAMRFERSSRFHQLPCLWYSV